MHPANCLWDANCAIRPGERWLNDAGHWLGNLSQVDLKSSPYLFPLREIETFATATWPMPAALWPPSGPASDVEMDGRTIRIRGSTA